MEVSGRKRNSQDDTLPRSKINTETDTLEQKAWNVHSLVGKMLRQHAKQGRSFKSLPTVVCSCHNRDGFKSSDNNFTDSSN